MSNYFGNYAGFEKPMRDDFKLHTHELYEIYVFLNGDVDYIVEGTTYPLSPYDIIVLRPGEMHRAYHKTQKKYERIVFNVDDEFFELNNCIEYKAVFNDRDLGKKNKLSAEFVKSSGLYDTIKRWMKYTNKEQNFDSAISKATFIEILYLMNNVDEPYFDDEDNESLVQRVISYINKNFTSKITLEELEDEFFVSRYHLCREFKRVTGHTIISYVNNKRLSLVKQLYKQGESINKICVDAGFSSYSSFYKAYLKEYGVIPKDGLREDLLH